MTALVFADHRELSDLASYAARGRRLDPDAAMRLVADGTVLAAYVGVLPGRGLGGAGAVMGLRVVHLAQPAQLDATVPVAAVLDRVARDRPLPQEGPVALPVPPMRVFAPWAAVSPPRSGWQSAGSVPTGALVSAAAAGIAEVAAAGTGPAAQVDALRARVWGRPLEVAAEGPGAPAGLAFAAYGLGFLVEDGVAALHRAGPWWRLSTSAGHALAR